MDCTTLRSYIDAHIDGELDLVTTIDIERHLADCPDCVQRLRNRQFLREGLASQTLRFAAPVALQRQVETALFPPQRVRLIEQARRHLWLSLVAALLVGIVISAGLFRSTTTVDPDRLLAQQVVDSHIRSLMVDHLADVISTDRHTVKPWFDGKIDFSPTVIDLAAQGFPLTGGRLDYLDGEPVTALVYQYQKHIINLFMRPSAGLPDSGNFSTTLQGYHLIHWADANSAYWAVSDLEMTELQVFVQLIKSDLSTVTPESVP